MILERETGVPGPIMSVDAGSVYGCPSALRHSVARQRMGVYTEAFREAQWERAGLSLQPALINLNGELIDRDAILQATSGDLPGLTTFGGLLALVADRRNKQNGAHLISKTEILGRLAFTTNRWSYDSITRLLLKSVMPTESHGIVLRTDSGATDNEWLVDHVVGEVGRSIIEDNLDDDVTIAIEINRRHHPTLRSYLDHILALRESYGDIFAVSFDTAHMSQEAGNGAKISNTGIAEETFAHIMDMGREEGFNRGVIALVELNPVNRDGMSHVSLAENIVNWRSIAEIWEEKANAGPFTHAPHHYVYEPHPFRFPNSNNDRTELVERFEELRDAIPI